MGHTPTFPALCRLHAQHSQGVWDQQGVVSPLLPRVVLAPDGGNENQSEEADTTT